MERFKILDNRTRTAFSSIFSVSPGNVAIVRAFNMQAYRVDRPHGVSNSPQLLILQQVVLESSGYKSCPVGGCSTSQEFELLQHAPIEFAEDITQCGMWTMSSCNNLMVIGLPGYYRLRLNDSGAIGTINAFWEDYGRGDILIPDNILFGNI